MRLISLPLQQIILLNRSMIMATNISPSVNRANRFLSEKPTTRDINSCFHRSRSHSFLWDIGTCRFPYIDWLFSHSVSLCSLQGIHKSSSLCHCFYWYLNTSFQCLSLYRVKLIFNILFFYHLFIEIKIWSTMSFINHFVYEN